MASSDNLMSQTRKQTSIYFDFMRWFNQTIT